MKELFVDRMDVCMLMGTSRPSSYKNGDIILLEYCQMHCFLSLNLNYNRQANFKLRRRRQVRGCAAGGSGERI